MSGLGRQVPRLRVYSWCHGFKSSDAIMSQNAEVRFLRFVFGDGYSGLSPLLQVVA